MGRILAAFSFISIAIIIGGVIVIFTRPKNIPSRSAALSPREEFERELTYIRENIKDSAKLNELRAAMSTIEKLVNGATLAEREDIATFRVWIDNLELEVYYQNAIRIEQDPANINNYPLLTATFQELEERIGPRTSRICYENAQWVELHREIQQTVDAYADLWAASPSGFAAAKAIDLLAESEFTNNGTASPRWTASPMAKFKFTDHKLITSAMNIHKKELDRARAAPNSRLHPRPPRRNRISIITGRGSAF